MRWITFLILLYLMFALQNSHLGAFPHGPGGDAPWPKIEYLPLLAVFYALFAGETAAPLAVLVCGLAYDVGNRDYAGTNMVPLAFSALLVMRVRLTIFREHALTHAIITFLMVLTFGVLSVAGRSLMGAPLYGQSPWAHLLVVAGNGVYTAMAAPAYFWLFFRLGKLLGFSYQGPRHWG